MRSKKYTVLALAIAMTAIGCSNNQENKSEVAKPLKDTTDVEVVEAAEEVEEQAPEPTKTQSQLNELRAKYQPDSWEYELLDFIESEEMTASFELDKVPFEGEELPAEATIQLDNLTDISTAFPFLNLEIQAHTTAAETKVGKAAKKATSKARAMWVSTKLNMRGIPSERLSSSGMADEELIEGLEPEDKRHKRIVAVLKKAEE